VLREQEDDAKLMMSREICNVVCDERYTEKFISCTINFEDCDDKFDGIIKAFVLGSEIEIEFKIDTMLAIKIANMIDKNVKNIIINYRENLVETGYAYLLRSVQVFDIDEAEHTCTTILKFK